MARLTGISPVLLVADLERSVAYFRDRLGFECRTSVEYPRFATADRDEATILLCVADDPSRLVPNWQLAENMWNAYIRVDDVNAVYAEVQERGAGIDYAICDQPWGFREFGVQDPDRHDIAFGQRIVPLPE